MQVRSARVTMMMDNMAGIRNARSIVQWAFNEDTKVGQVADQVYECDGMFVVVALKDVFKKGYATLDQVRTMIEQPVRVEKKAAVLMARANDESMVKMQMEQGYRSKARMTSQVLRDKAKIEDQRNKFF